MGVSRCMQTMQYKNEFGVKQLVVVWHLYVWNFEDGIPNLFILYGLWKIHIYTFIFKGIIGPKP